MAKAARKGDGKRKLCVLTDCRSCSSSEIKACEDAGITALAPKPMTFGAWAEDRFVKSNFVCISWDDE